MFKIIMNYLSRFIVFVGLYLSLFPVYLYANESSSIKLYEQLKRIKHLNSSENALQLNTIIIKINASEYDGMRAPFYAYGAKLTSNHGDAITGDALIERAVDALPKVKSSDLLVDTLDYLSWIQFNRGDYGNAIYYVQKMADHAFESSNERGQAIALNRLAFSYLELGFNELAIEPLNSALELARKTNNKDAQFLGLLYLINARIDSPNAAPQETKELINTAANIISPLNENDGYLPRLKGIVYHQLGDNEKALRWLNQSLDIATGDHDIRLLRMIHQDFAEFHLANNQTEQAEQHALTSLSFATKLNHHNSIATLHSIFSKIHQRNNNNIKAFNHLSLYTNFLTSDTHKNIINLLTMMNKRMDNTEQQKKIIALENSVLGAELQVQKSYNEQYFTFISILGVTFAFVILTIVYFIRTRILSMKVALSMKDTLTGAFGRSYMQHYLPGAVARYLRANIAHESFGVIAIDCDDFKLINEKHGHAGGDIALKTIADTLKLQIRTNDHLFRWGGDEFVLMCEHVSQPQLGEIAQRLISSVNNLCIEYENCIITPTISVGYALHKKNNEFDLGHLLKQADKYLFQSKRSGKNGFIGG